MRFNKVRDNFETLKAKEIQNSWHQKTSSLDLEHNTGRLWNLTKSLNEDVTTTQRATIIEEAGEFHTGKKAVNPTCRRLQGRKHNKGPTRKKERSLTTDSN